MLILDDATSSVDATTERQIKRALDEAMAERTTFIIAHRLSTIALADEIVVLEDGRIVAHGDHDELLEASALYREIVEKGLPDSSTASSREREVSGMTRMAALDRVYRSEITESPIGQHVCKAHFAHCVLDQLALRTHIGAGIGGGGI